MFDSGMFDWGMSLPPRNEAGLVHVVIDTPKGSGNKLELFFVGYNRAHGRHFKPLAHRGPRHAERLLRAATQPPDQGRGVKRHDRGKTPR
jgi:hypothetical protein